MNNKIILPFDLFSKTIELLETVDNHLDVGDCPSETIQLYGYVLYTFKQKMAFLTRFKNINGYNDFDNTGDFCFSCAKQEKQFCDDDLPF
jgi:hypothetical protein